MNRISFLHLLVLVLISSNALAGDAPWHGIWKGTIDGQQVMVCLDDQDSSSYYYRRHSKGISIAAKDRAGTRWTEVSKGKKTGEWKLEPVLHDRLTGNWFAPKGKRSAPVILERINVSSGAELCDSEAYNGPRIEAAKIEAGKPERFEGKQYRILFAGVETKVSTIEIMESGAYAANVNRALREKLRNEIKNYFRCYDSVSAREEVLAEYSVSETPVFWTSRWLTLAESIEDYCGGLHPNHGNFYTTWDLELGKVADIWKWFKGGKNMASPSLNKVIIAHADSDAECSEAIAENSSYNLHPAKEGMVFYTQLPHVAVGCQNDIIVPYRKLRPFLATTGRTEVKAIMGAAR